MLTPEQLKDITLGAEKIAEELHNNIVKSIVKRIILRLGRGENYIMTSTDKWQLELLRDAGEVMEEVQAEIARLTRLQADVIRVAMEEAGYQSYKYDSEMFKKVNISTEALKQSPAYMRIMQAGYKKTFGEWKNFTRTMADASQKIFITECDKAHNLVVTGAVGYNKAIRDAVEEVGKRGVYVTYPSGKTDTIEVATARAVRTGVAQTCAEATMARIDDEKWGIVLVSAHLGARCKGGIPENHEMWQGKFYSLPQYDNTYPDFYAQTGYGDILGLCGVNCRHSFAPSDGKTNPYDGHEIDTEENRKRYEAEQKQRAKERGVRARKRRVMALRTAVDNCKDPSLKAELEARYQREAYGLQQANKDYKDYCEKEKLPTEQERLHVSGWDRSQAAKATGAAAKWKRMVS